MSSDFARVLTEAGEPEPGPRPAGWVAAQLLARMREDVAAHRARTAARWAVNAGSRQAARELYQRTCEQAGLEPRPLPPWLGDDGPSFRILGSRPGCT